MLNDKDGQLSLARTAYIATLLSVLAKMLVSGVTYGDIVFGTADFTGMALILGAVAATYFKREQDK